MTINGIAKVGCGNVKEWQLSMGERSHKDKIKRLADRVTMKDRLEMWWAIMWWALIQLGDHVLSNGLKTHVSICLLIGQLLACIVCAPIDVRLTLDVSL